MKKEGLRGRMQTTLSGNRTKCLPTEPSKRASPSDRTNGALPTEPSLEIANESFSRRPKNVPSLDIGIKEELSLIVDQIPIRYKNTIENKFPSIISNNQKIEIFHKERLEQN